MRITIVANPRSGRGKALGLGGELEALLLARGHSVFRPDLTPELDLRAAAEGSDRLVIVGGDGTIHHAAGPAAASGVPVYHLATGTENLFARYFRMPRNPLRAVTALELDHAPRAIDLGSASGLPFCLMCSFGVDASTIHRVEAARGRTGGHLAYVVPVFAETFHPRPARLRISGDGRTIAEGFVGTAVVANLPAYALRVDPCPDADPHDGMLDLALLPATTSLSSTWQMVRCKLRSRGIQRVRAREFTITALHDSPSQIDGECPRATSPLPPTLRAGETVTLTTWTTPLRVHAPPVGGS